MQWVRAHQALLWWMGALSLATLVASAILCPILIARLPEDYFIREERRPARRFLPLRFAALARNLLGGVLLLAGAVMLLVPGQGILTMLIGLTLIGFPGKRGLEYRLARIPTVGRTLNWIRRRAGQAPFILSRPVPSDPPRAPDPG